MWWYFFLAGCSDIQEASIVQVPIQSVYIDSLNRTDLGWLVTVEQLEIAVHDFTFHTSSVASRVWSMPFVSSAFAHPGHGEDSLITGELSGSFTWGIHDDSVLGYATLTVGDYSYVDVGIHNQLPNDVAIVMTGVAEHFDYGAVSFDTVLVVPAERLLSQIPFTETITARSSSQTINFELHVVDPFESQHLFDGIAFQSVGSSIVVIDESHMTDAYNLLHRRFLSHDHYLFTLE
jgi:hypothetical protein